MWLKLPMIIRVQPSDPPEVQKLNGTINTVLINTDNIIGVFRNVSMQDRAVVMLAAQVSVDVALTADAIWNALADTPSGMNYCDLMGFVAADFLT